MSESGADASPMSDLVAAVLDALRDENSNLEPLVRVCQACVSLLPVDGASISVIVDAGRRLSLFASDAVIQHVDDLQFGLGEGPCFEAFDSGRPVLVPDLATEGSTVWPIFAAEIAAQPVGGIFAFPLRRGAAKFGAMDMYRTDPGWFSEHELATALQIVDIATSALLAASATGPGVVIREAWLADMNRNRLAVHQATGMVVAEFRVPADQALALLRAYSYGQGRPLDDVATDLVARRLHPGVINT